MAKFVITAGHSDTDSGAVANGINESEIAEDMRNMIALKLRDLGHTVITDGSGKVNQSLSDAIKLIKQGDIALEIHCNAAGSASATGVETISLPKHKKLSQELSKAIASVTMDKLRGDKGWIDQSQSHRGKLGYVNAGGIITELFFLSNAAALSSYNSVKWVVASAITRTLVEWSEGKIK